MQIDIMLSVKTSKKLQISELVSGDLVTLFVSQKELLKLYLLFFLEKKSQSLGTRPWSVKSKIGCFKLAFEAGLPTKLTKQP